IALLLTRLGRGTRARFRTLAPWSAIALFSILVAPVVIWEARRGFSMLTHRLVETQLTSGFSFRNLGAFVGGQLLYVSPPILIGGGFLLVDLFRQRKADEI